MAAATPVSMQQLVNAGVDCNTIATIATSTAETVVDRLGQTKLTMAGVTKNIQNRYSALNNKGDWVTSFLYVSNDLVKYSGVVYICLLGHMSGVFANDSTNKYWQVYQGLTKVDLGSPTGAELVGTSRVPDTSGSTFPTSLDFYIKSSPIDLRLALPSVHVTDGSVDYSVYVQKVYNYLAQYGGGKVIVPHNMSILIGNIETYQGIETFGNDWTSILKVKPNCYGLSLNPDSKGTSNVDDNARNVRFSGFNLQGAGASASFSEFYHLLNLNAFSHLSVDDVKISGAQGDHIYIGSGNAAGLERHNTNFKSSGVLIDGINNQNRNGISIVDIDGFDLSNFEIRNTTKSNMPGAIDFEPDNQAFHKICNTRVSRGKIKNVLGTGAMGVYLPTAATDVYNMLFEDISIEGFSNGPAIFATADRDSSRQEVASSITFRNIKAKNGKLAFDVTGIKGVTIEDSTFIGTTNAGLVAGLNSKVTRNTTLRNNNFHRCGSASAAGAFSVGNARSIDLIENTLVDCGVAGGAQVFFEGGTSDNVKFTKNEFDNPALINTTSVSYFNHSFTASTNQMEGNVFSGTTTSCLFPSFRTDYIGQVQNSFTPSTPPSSFPFGLSRAFVNAPVGGGLPDAYTQGILSVEKFEFGSGADRLTIQKFTPRGIATQLDTFYRYPVAGDGGWDVWRRVSAT